MGGFFAGALDITRRRNFRELIVVFTVIANPRYKLFHRASWIWCAAGGGWSRSQVEVFSVGVGVDGLGRRGRLRRPAWLESPPAAHLHIMLVM